MKGESDEQEEKKKPSKKPSNVEEQVEDEAQNKSEPDDEDDDEGVTVSEEFQKSAHALTKSGSKHEMRHLHDKANAREDEIRKDEMKKGPKKFSTEGMPSSY